VEFRILGPLEVVEGGRPVDVGSPKQRAVLAVLVINANRVVSVDRLIDELWGDEAPSAATGTLQAYVSNLRRALEPGRAPREPPQVLVTRAPGYLLRLDPADLDAARFEAEAAAGNRLLAEGRAAQARTTLDAALARWRGPALADFAFESFAQGEIARLHELRLGAEEDRLAALVDLGSHAEAVAMAEGLVAGQPLRERVWGLLMTALYRSGRQADALRAYQTARRHLAEELGLEPGPALRRLEADMLAQAPSLDWRPAPTVPAAEPVAAPEPAPAPGPHEEAGGEQPLVGRVAEVDRLRVVLARVAAGRGGVVVVGGEPGIGKTRLAEELVAEARARGYRAAWGGSLEGGGTPAYWPWVAVVRDLAGSADPAGLAEAMGPGAGELAQVVPEVKELAGTMEAPAVVDPETARLRLFEAVAGLLGALARRSPLLVVLDDLQWADSASLQLLGFLGGRLRATPLLVAATYRPAEVGADHPLAAALAALARHQVVERLDLAGLAEDEVGRLIASTTGAAADPRVVAVIRARTEGNPFFVAELARLLAAEHDLRPEAVARAVPAGVRDVVRRRLARLPEQTTALLSLAAVAGQEFELRVLEAAAGLEPERALELVEAALAAGLVTEDADVVGRFRFSHDLVRETVAEELSALRRARLHARLAEAVEADAGGGDGRAVVLAHHFFHAVPATGPERAVAWAVRAAEVEAARLAHEQAEHQLGRALGLVGRLPAGEGRDRQELDVLVRLISLVSVTRGYAAPVIGEWLERARELAGRLGERRHALRVAYGLMTFRLVSARHDDARRYAEHLLELAGESGDSAELVAAHAAIGVAALHQGQVEVARDHMERALALDEGLHDPWLVAWFPLHPVVASMSFLAWAVWQLGDPDEAARLAAATVEAARRSEHPLSIAHALHLAAHVAVLAGDPETVLQLEDEAVAYSEDKGFPLYRALGTVIRGWATAELGSPEAGAEAIVAGMAAMEATGAWMVHTLYLGLLAEAQRRAGRPVDALESVERGLALVEPTGERFYEAELRRLRGELLREVAPERAAEARRELDRALEVARAQRARSLEERVLASLQRLTGSG
jgi:DNA-binding SARP family transcriptional activator/RecA/RadA recombinase